MVGSYCRGVNTQIGGTYAKYVGVMMQTVVTGPHGSDCGSKHYLKYKITSETSKIIEYAYGIIGGKEVMLTTDIINANMILVGIINRHLALHIRSSAFK